MQGVFGLRVVVPCYWGMQLQIARRLITVASRWSWVAMGGAVLLGNATVDLPTWSKESGSTRDQVQRPWNPKEETSGTLSKSISNFFQCIYPKA